MSIHVVGQNGGEQSGGGSIRCRIIEDGSHTEHRLGLNRRLLVADGAAPGQAFGGPGGRPPAGPAARASTSDDAGAVMRQAPGYAEIRENVLYRSGQ